MKTKAVAIPSILLLVALSLMGSAPAQAANALDPGFVAEVTSVWTQYGVKPAVQTKLLAQLRTTGFVQGMSSDSVPVKTKVVKSNGQETTVATYADGSISVTSHETPRAATGGVSTQSVSNCTYKVVTMGVQTAKGCTAFGWFTAVQLAFIFDATLRSNGGSSIDRYYSATVQCNVASCSAPVFELIRKTQSGSTPATLSLTTTWQLTPVGTGTTRLGLFVKNTSLTTN